MAAQLAAAGEDGADGLRALHGDPALRALHERLLPPAARRKRGDIDPARAMAEAKLNDAETLDDAVAWLGPKERMMLLHDRALLGLLARLPGAVRPQGNGAQGRN